ncbi:hypothetical protein [Ideonella sp.]|uniref:RCC1 domain-containing protein n=1 Tax=Ideonella sp. TaxID=1929293 RepID=UPI002B46986C|nr:hypothetical protein [Ideonella sp.]HJV70301.1 hypothetical protein [Ideonella sp.]
MSYQLRVAFAASFVMSACGGGGASAPASASGQATSSQATATLVAPADGRAEWNRATSLQVSLRDGTGTLIPHPSCSTADASTIALSGDCSTMTGYRLGTFNITVSGGGVSRDVAIKVIPQRATIATNQTGSTGSGGFNAVIAPSGQLFTWGANSFGVLGQGLNEDALAYKALPVPVKNPTGTGELNGIVAASAGNRSVLALTEDGEVYVWGQGATVAFTQQDQISLPAKMPNAANNGSLNHIVAVSAGDSNCVALADDGTIYAWGNYAAQGSSGADHVVYPLKVKTPDGSGVLHEVVAIAAGWNYSLALMQDGRIVAWGFNSSGVTGASSTIPVQPLPRFITRALDGSPLSGMVSLSAGYNFAMALAADGKVYAWGANPFGQIGQGVQQGTYRQAVIVKDSAGSGELSNIASISAGGNHALALDADGNAFTWGYSQNGQLGDGANHPRVNQGLLPAPVVSENGTGQLSNMVGLASGFGHSLALTSDGNVLVWGSGLRGNLGQGESTFADSFIPIAVKGPDGSGELSLAPLAVSRTSYRRYR